MEILYLIGDRCSGKTYFIDNYTNVAHIVPDEHVHRLRANSTLPKERFIGIKRVINMYYINYSKFEAYFDYSYICIDVDLIMCNYNENNILYGYNDYKELLTILKKFNTRVILMCTELEYNGIKDEIKKFS